MADLVLPRGEIKVLKAEDKDYERGLLVRLLKNGGYDMAYWYNKPDKPYPVEVLVDGKSIKKDAKVVEMKFHPKDYYDKVDEAPRIPRKKGQHRGSKSHSDLYTDENPKGTIKGLKFATVADAKASVSKIRGSGKSHAHKIQAAVAMEQRAREMGKTSQAAVYRAFINKMKKKTKKKNEEFGAPAGMLPSPSRKTVKKMKRKGHTSVPYGSGYKKVNENDKAELYKLYTKAMKMMPGSPNQKKIKKQITVLRKKLGMNEMLNYPFYGRNVAQVPGNQKDGEHRYYLPKKYRKKNEAVVVEVTECGCSNIYKVEKVNEKWSKKYKKSINCNNPKGFSQKAHCAGRKKK